MHAHPLHLKITRLYEDTGRRFPNWQKRIEQQLKLGRINMIIVDGKAQTGKSTLARYIAKKYDDKFVQIFQVEEILTYLEKLKGWWYAGQHDKIYNKWIFFDEPQLETPKQEFWSQRNMVIQAFTSSFGFLHNHLIMALPNIKGLSDVILTNISMRITVKSYLGKSEDIIRKGYIKLPIWNEFKQKFFWVSVEDFTIPTIEEDCQYIADKADNFFNNQLEKWKNKLKIKPKVNEKMREEVDNFNVMSP